MRWHIALLYGLMRMLACVPLRVLQAGGTAIGWALRVTHARVAHHVRVNLTIARPELDAATRSRLVRAALAQFGHSLAEMAWIWGRGARRALKRVRRVEGQALFEAALADPAGLIIAAPHLGCWELLNYWLCAHTRMAILYRPPRLAAFEPLLRKVRGDLAPEQVRAARAGVRTLLQRLRAGGTVGILPDQKPRAGEGHIAPFFGRNVLTMVLLSRLAAHTGATVLFAFAERLAHGRGYVIHFLPAPAGIADADLDVACAALNAGVEACVGKAFAQYQWPYRRYSGFGLQNPYD